ncbi:hypothetical protein C8R44DRAFT_745461 [Mycena epipterygia]|nr:hypothetical protein C8R44DRAFT_745461 [Mycena epipterygia]
MHPLAIHTLPNTDQDIIMADADDLTQSGLVYAPPTYPVFDAMAPLAQFMFSPKYILLLMLVSMMQGCRRDTGTKSDVPCDSTTYPPLGQRSMTRRPPTYLSTQLPNLRYNIGKVIALVADATRFVIPKDLALSSVCHRLTTIIGNNKSSILSCNTILIYRQTAFFRADVVHIPSPRGTPATWYKE